MTEKKASKRVFSNVPKIIEASEGNQWVMKALMTPNDYPASIEMLNQKFMGCFSDEPVLPVRFEDLATVDRVMFGGCECGESRIVSHGISGLLGIIGEKYLVGVSLSMGVFSLLDLMDLMALSTIPPLPEEVNLSGVKNGDKVVINGREMVLLEIKTRDSFPSVAYFALTEHVTPAGSK